MTQTLIRTLILTTATVSLTACGATTGGLQSALAQKAVSQAVASQMSADETVVAETTTTTTTVITPMDMSAMTPECKAIAVQMASTDVRISAAKTVLNGNGEMAGQAAASIASTAAAHSGAASVLNKVPFGGMFAKAAMDGAAKSGKKKAKKAQKDLNAATLERAKLEGLYAGKGC